MGITPVNNDASHPVVDNPKVVPAAKPATPEEAPVPQFKIVRVRKPDGTIVKVKRPITADGKHNLEIFLLPLANNSQKLQS